MSEPAENDDKDVSIELNVHWLAVRSDNTYWTLFRKDKVGRYQIKDVVQGSRRTIFALMDSYQINPTPEALAWIDTLPEVAGFPYDEDEAPEINGGKPH